MRCGKARHAYDLVANVQQTALTNFNCTTDCENHSPSQEKPRTVTWTSAYGDLGLFDTAFLTRSRVVSRSTRSKLVERCNVLRSSIEGTADRSPCRNSLVPDRMEVGTFCFPTESLNAAPRAFRLVEMTICGTLQLFTSRLNSSVDLRTAIARPTSRFVYGGQGGI